MRQAHQALLCLCLAAALAACAAPQREAPPLAEAEAMAAEPALIDPAGRCGDDPDDGIGGTGCTPGLR